MFMGNTMIFTTWIQLPFSPVELFNVEFFLLSFAFRLFTIYTPLEPQGPGFLALPSTQSQARDSELTPGCCRRLDLTIVALYGPINPSLWTPSREYWPSRSLVITVTRLCVLIKKESVFVNLYPSGLLYHLLVPPSFQQMAGFHLVYDWHSVMYI